VNVTGKFIVIFFYNFESLFLFSPNFAKKMFLLV